MTVPQPAPGRPVHLDSAGIERTPNRWGFNSFLSAEGAEEEARSIAKRQAPSRRAPHWFIWRLSDGTYDWSVVPDPGTPGHDHAVLVRRIAR